MEVSLFAKTTLLTIWQRGWLLIEEADELKTFQHHKYCRTILTQMEDALSRSPGSIDILQPFGSLIAHPEHTLDPSNNEFDDDDSTRTTEGSNSALPCAFEDALAEEDADTMVMAAKKFDRFVMHKGQKVNKA